jgi:hypothetical protein
MNNFFTWKLLNIFFGAFFSSSQNISLENKEWDHLKNIFLSFKQTWISSLSHSCTRPIFQYSKFIQRTWHFHIHVKIIDFFIKEHIKFSLIFFDHRWQLRWSVFCFLSATKRCLYFFCLSKSVFFSEIL